MCGIVGAICKARCSEIVLDALQKIEYRGYDSAGICLKNGCQCSVYKTEGYINKLRSQVPSSLAPVAIAHTRWATHGKVCKKNAHPISSQDGAWTIVHNGIIENYEELKCLLEKKGVRFFTDTDSEVIAALLALETFSDPVKNVVWTAKKLKGSFAFCAIKNEVENVVYGVKFGSPLYAYLSGNKAMVASDPICFPSGGFFKLEDGEICKLTQKDVVFCDFFGKNVKKEEFFISNINYSVDKGNFQHYMLKEIYETPKTLCSLANFFKDFDDHRLKNLRFERVKLIGCGTAHHACLMGASFMRSVLKIDAEAITASEYRYGNYIVDKSTLCIFVSQSGETADTIAAYKKASQKTKNLISLTNVLHSTLATISDITIPLCAGPEIAVASTKAYSNQVAALCMLTYLFKGKDALLKNINHVLTQAPQMVFCDEEAKRVAQRIFNHDKVFFIGRDNDFITALEGALKLKEISYINCSAFAAGELKHGTLALVEDGTPVIVIATNKKVFKKTMNSALEAKSRGAKLFLISPFELKEKEKENFEEIISFNAEDCWLKSIQAALPLQLLSYYVSLKKNLNPDKPRNLAKSVTVE